jgi:hypothetical protein
MSQYFCVNIFVINFFWLLPTFFRNVPTFSKNVGFFNYFCVNILQNVATFFGNVAIMGCSSSLPTVAHWRLWPAAA